MKEQKDLRVVIIGAGLSGLLTAYRLKKTGVKIKILEARGRAGGRINTVQGKNGPPMEMGATWFGRQHGNLINLLKELNLEGFKQFSEGSVIFEASSFSPSQLIELPPQDPSFRILGGTNKLIQTLAGFYTAEEIVFNERVEQIKIDRDEIYIKTNNRTLSAEKVICCIPPALLVNSIEFLPQLPEHFLAVAKNTHTWMQESVKAGVVYQKPFWREQWVSTIISNHGPVIEYYDHSNATDSKFSLCGFLHPDYAKLDKDEREAKVIAQLQRLLGKEAADYIGYEEVVWQNEKFTNDNTGEIFMPHQNNGNSILREPLYGGKVLISNSETSPVYGGYMEGAVYSANEVAKRVLGSK